MAMIDLSPFSILASIVKGAPHKYLWTSYDEEADTLYVHFRESATATDSEITDDDIIIRYDGGEVVGATFLNASQR